MGKLEENIRSEMIRLAKREFRKVSAPWARNVRSLRSTISQIRKTVLAVQQLTAHREKELAKRKIPLEAIPEEVKMSRFSPHLLRSLRKHLGITQKELAVLAGVTMGAVPQWESGKFKPRDEKKRVMAALRKLGRRDVRKLLQEK